MGNIPDNTSRIKSSVQKQRLLVVMIFVLYGLIIFPPITWGKDKLRVIYTDWYPYTYSEGEKASGFEIEIFRAVIHNMGLDAEYKQLPWKRCLETLRVGGADALISMLMTDERKEYTYYPDEHISISKTVFATTRDRDIIYNGSLDSLKKFTIGVILGFSYGSIFDDADFLNRDPAVNTTILLNKLLRGRNDLVAENQIVLSAYAHRNGIFEKIRFLDPPIHSQNLYVGFSRAKNLKQMCDDFSTQLRHFKNTEAYQNILKRYHVDVSWIQ